MSLKNEFILLSELIKKLEGNEYYITYAKSLALTENSSMPLPSDDDLIEEMFFYFIKTNELKAYHCNSNIDNNLEEIDISDNYENIDLTKSETYVKVKDLKKLYANKCIVFPSSLLQ